MPTHMVADGPSLAPAQAMRPKVKKLGPMCVQTHNAAGELEIAPMPAFTIGGPVRTPPPRLAPPVDVPADAPRPDIAAPAAAPAAAAQPAAEVQPSSALQLPAAVAAAPPARASVASEAALPRSPGVAPAQDVSAPKTTQPAASVCMQPAAPQCELTAAGSPATAAAPDPASRIDVRKSPEASAASLAAPEPAADLAAPSMRPLQAECSSEAGVQSQNGEPQSAQQYDAVTSTRGQPADAPAAAATNAHLADAAVPEATPVAAPASPSSSQAAPAPVSNPAGGLAVGCSAGSSAEAMPMVSVQQPPAPVAGGAPPAFAVSGREHSGAQPLAPGPADGISGHDSVSVSQTAAVAAQRAAFEAALGMALELDCGTLTATQLNRPAIGGDLARPPAAAPLAQQLIAQQGSQQTAMGVLLAPVSDPVAMFLNDGPDR